MASELPDSPVGMNVSGAPAGRVTIVVASHNRRAMLLRSPSCHLTLPEAPRVLVVVDGSTDDTARVVRARHPKLEVIRLELTFFG